MTESSNNATTIQLDTMSLEQLDQLQQREENRLPLFTQRLAALRSAAARLSASAAAVTELYPKEENEKNPDDKTIEIATTTTSTAAVESPLSTPSLPLYKPVFVPLTESVYLPGQICTDAKSATLLVELGTGYFVEQDVARTVDFLDRKRTMVAANADNGASIRIHFVPPMVCGLGVDSAHGRWSGIVWLLRKVWRETASVYSCRICCDDRALKNWTVALPAHCFYLFVSFPGLRLSLFWGCVCMGIAVAQMVQATRQNLDSIAVAMRGKMLEIQARQQGQRHREQQEAGDSATTSA
jgi:Prefoldin subunit